MLPRSTLSFRTFHEKHFSPASRTAFFETVAQADQDATEEEIGDSEPETDQERDHREAHDEKRLPLHVQQLRTWLVERQSAQSEYQQNQWCHHQSYDPYWMYRYPPSYGNHPGQQTNATCWWSDAWPLQDNHTGWTAENGADHVQDVVDEEIGEVAEDPTVDDDAAAVPEPILSKETIAIFEFSRKFREQKAAAAKLEKEKAKRLRAKRKRAVMRGFAMGEALSEEEEEEEKEEKAIVQDGNETTSRSVKRGRGNDSITNAGQESDADSDGGDDDDDDDGPLIEEPPANDTSFLSIPPIYKERLHNKLYGGSLPSLEKQAQVASLPSLPATEGSQAKKEDKTQQAIHELMQIQYLESLLDRSYEDSLQQPLVSCADDDSVALWPGMPLRC